MIVHEGALGYMSLNLGDLLADGLYEIVRKLGWGTNSSVWLALDRYAPSNASPRYIVLKILNTYATDLEHENLGHEFEAHSRLQFARYVPGVGAAKIAAGAPAPDINSRSKVVHAGYQHCLVLSPDDCFSAYSLHGSHFCYVATTLCGPTLWQILRNVHCLPFAATKRVARQTLLALDYIHTKAKLIHGDVKTDNLFIKINADGATIAEYLRDWPSQTYLARSHPAIFNGEPITTVKSEPFPAIGLLPSFNNLDILLGDFSCAVPCEKITPETFFCTSTDVRAPEQLLGGPCSTAVDIWGLGCVIYKCLTGHGAFSPPFDTDIEDPCASQYTDLHLTLIEDRIGPFPRDFLTRCLQMDDHFDSADVESDTRELEAACTFLRRCFTIDPECRPTAAQLLEDEWLQSR
ncbi:kinase-like domain-containing protein [Trametes polyzona]|nr:kinase-like domain-containing protein [Trametes polyzona]